MSEVKDETIKNHLLEPGGAMGIHGEGYPENSMFRDVTIQISNGKKIPIMVKLTATGLFVELVRGS